MGLMGFRGSTRQSQRRLRRYQEMSEASMSVWGRFMGFRVFSWGFRGFYEIQGGPTMLQGISGSPRRLKDASKSLGGSWKFSQGRFRRLQWRIGGFQRVPVSLRGVSNGSQEGVSTGS